MLPRRPRGRPRADEKQREREARACLLRAAGCSAREVALAMDVSERTIRSWTSRARRGQHPLAVLATILESTRRS